MPPTEAINIASALFTINDYKECSHHKMIRVWFGYGFFIMSIRLSEVYLVFRFALI